MIPRLLNEFTLKDKFNNSIEDLEEYALGAAHRRDEVYQEGWKDIFVKVTLIESTIKFEAKEYKVEIWGQTIYTCPKCRGTSSDTWCNNSSCPQMPCCGEPKEGCKCG